MKIAAYARVSTDDQANEGYSLEAQLDMLNDYVESQDNWEIFDRYVDDGYTGRNTKRPEYTRMMNDIEHWDAIAVVKMDRIHRNSRNFMAMMDFLEKKKRSFVSSSDSLDTSTAAGRFAMDIIQRIAQFESEQIGERTYFAMEEKAKMSDGKIMGFTAPFGYTAYKGELFVNAEEMETVKEIFKSYASGMTMDEICWRLNRNGILTRKQNPWNKFNLRNILHNPVYAGLMRWDGIFIRHNADVAVTEKEFNDVQTMMASKVRDPNKRRASLIKEAGCVTTPV